MISPSVESALLGETHGELVLRVRGTHRHGQKIHLAKPKCTVGSAADCSLRLAAPGIQPLHCLILQGERGSVVRRWGPDTRLNGQSFHDAALAVGDRLSVGPLEFDILSLPKPLGQDPLETQNEELLEPPTAGQAADAAAELLQVREDQRELRKRMRKLARRRVEQLISRLREARHEALDLQQSRRSQEATMLSLTSEAEQLREKAHTQQQRYEAAERDRQQLVARLQELAGREPGQAAIAHELETSQTEDLRQQLAASQELLISTEADLAASREAQAEGEGNVAQYQQELETLRSELAARESELAELRAEGGSIDETLNSLRIALEEEQQRSTIAREAWENQRTRIETELESAREALAASEQDREGLLHSHAEELQQLETTLREQSELETEATSQPQAEELQRLAAEVERLEQLLCETSEQLAAERSAWADRQESWEHDRGQLEEQCRELTETTERLQQIEQEVSQETDHSELREELDMLSQNLEAKKAELLAECESHQEERARFERERQAAEISLEEQRNLLGDERMSISAEQNRLAALQQEQETRHYDLQARMAELEEREQQLERQRERLASEGEEPAPAIQAEVMPETDEPTSYEPTSSDYEEQVPTSEAPVSTADVLARFGHRLEDLEDEAASPTEQESNSFGSLYREQEQEPHSQEEQLEEQSTPAWANAQPAAESPADDEESIESYMASLLRRVSGGADTPDHSQPLRMPSQNERSAPAEATADTNEQGEAAVEPTAEPRKYEPRPAPPEMQSNLAAMRNLANQSARSAIDHSARRRWGQAALGKFIVAVVASVSGILLWWWVSDTNVYGKLGLWVALIVATFWLVQSLILARKLLLTDGNEAAGDAVAPTATTAASTEQAAVAEEAAAAAEAEASNAEVPLD